MPNNLIWWQFLIWLELIPVPEPKKQNIDIFLDDKQWAIFREWFLDTHIFL